MADSKAMFFLGIILGSLAGFGLIWWIAAKNPSSEPLFSRLFRKELKSTRLAARVMLHDLQRKVEDLSTQLHRANQEIQELKGKIALKTNGGSFEKDSVALSDRMAKPGFAVPLNNLQAANEPLADEKRNGEIYRLFREGLSPGEIAGQLRMGRGEVELILSLDKKPSWVIGAKKIKGS